MNKLPFVQTYSSMSVFMGCPNQYKGRYVTNEVAYEPSPHTAFGNIIHSWMEKVVQAGSPPSVEVIRAAAEPHQETAHAAGKADAYPHMAVTVDAISELHTLSGRRKGAIQCESEIAITPELRACSYWDKGGMFRGKVDLLAFNPDTGILHMRDLKTGKPVNDDTQQRWYAAACMASMPAVASVSYRYVYTGGHDTPKREITRAEVPAVIQRIKDVQAEMAEAYATNTWEPRRNGLCRAYCGVLSCVHNGRRS